MQSSFEFNRKKAEKAREEGIARVESAADDDIFASLLRLTLEVCRQHPMFTTDDIWRLAMERGVDFPAEPRLMGSIMRHASTSLWAQPTDRVTPSLRVACHRRPLRVWQSLIYERS